MNKSFSLILASTLALALTFILGCKEEKKAETSSPAEIQAAETAEVAAEKSAETQETIAEETPSDENLCGGEKYDPAEKICIDGNISDPLCNGKKFNANTHSCLNGVLLVNNNDDFSFPERTDDEKYEADGGCDSSGGYDEGTHGCCGINDGGGATYKLDEAFCARDIRYRPEGPRDNHSIYKKCSGKEYDPEKQMCKGGKILDFKCGGKSFSVKYYQNYNDNAQFCFNDKLYDACFISYGDMDGNYLLYNPKKEGCCGYKGTYNLATHICEDGEIREK